MKNSVLVISLILISACKQNKESNHQSKLLIKNEIYIPKNVDNNFNLFLKHFSEDSAFQISRIHFPLKIKQLNHESGAFEDKIILFSNYDQKSFLPFNSKNQDYTQETIFGKEKTIILIQGIETGLVIDYEFHKIKGEWKLITWTDQST